MYDVDQEESMVLPHFIQVNTPEEILAGRTQFPDEDLILSRIPLTTLQHRGRIVDTAILDWDFTCTRDEAQWQAVQRAYLNGSLAQDEDDDRAFYYGGQPVYPASPHFQNDWWFEDEGTHDPSSIQAAYATRTIMRWAMAGVTREDLQRVGAQQILREGFKNIAENIENLLIVSLGIEELIQASLAHHGIHAKIAANRLFYHEDGGIRSHHPRVISGDVKGMVARRFLERFNIPVDHVLCVGDSIGDIEMMPEGALNILLLPRTGVDKQIGKWRDGHLPELWQKVRAVVVSDTFFPIYELIRRS
ncbi:hypothetical protein HQ487_01035 [Candidatus Uhrbacteria bacterium]|nr:hypothetical protein [Candidatus Uhrbacteria bacterium]